MNKYYDAMPEEFYTLSKLTVITPDLALAWITRMVAEGFGQFHFVESMS